MQGEDNVTIRIDTDVLGERNHSKVAWSDGYQIELLTEQSRLEQELLRRIKDEKRSVLTQELFAGQCEPDRTAEELIRQQMTTIPIFDMKSDYYSLNSPEADSGPGMEVRIAFFVLLGIVGYILARYRIKRRKEKEVHVHYRDHTDESIRV